MNQPLPRPIIKNNVPNILLSFMGRNFSAFVDIISKIAGVAALAIGGWWTYTHFIEYREDAENISVLVSAEPKNLENGMATTLINVSLKNIGKVPIHAESTNKTENSKWARHSGCELSIIEYDSQSKGNSDSKNLVVDWESSDRDQKYVIDDYDLLALYRASRNGNYILNPGVEYNEQVVISLKSGKLYGIRARFFSAKGWTNSDIKYFYVKV